VLTNPERSKARYIEVQKYQGDWKVVACGVDGKPLKDGGFTSVRFGAGSVTFMENDKSLKAKVVCGRF
jgi:hypothetical protein